MKKLLLAGVLAVTAVNMIGCTPGNNVPGSTLVGAGAGGLIGSAIFHNSFAGILAGSLIGGVIGDQVGQYMDRQDKINMQSAIINTPMYQQATWTSAQAGPGGQPVTYTVKPVKVYKQSNEECREYQTTVTIGGQAQQAYGTACRQPDGTWKIKNQKTGAAPAPQPQPMPPQ